jgi:hypothetical protein
MACGELSAMFTCSQQRVDLYMRTSMLASESHAGILAMVRQAPYL